MGYRVAWDNGAGACGVFPPVFSTYEQADAFGEDWAVEMTNTIDAADEVTEDGYTYEVIDAKEGD
jgi:hypothetical protein